MYADSFKLMSLGMYVRMNINAVDYKSESSIIHTHILTIADTCVCQSIHAFKLMSIGIAV